MNGVQTDQRVIRDRPVLMETRGHLERLVRRGTLGQKEKQAFQAFRVLLEMMATRETRDHKDQTARMVPKENRAKRVRV